MVVDVFGTHCLIAHCGAFSSCRMMMVDIYHTTAKMDHHRGSLMTHESSRGEILSASRPSRDPNNVMLLIDRLGKSCGSLYWLMSLSESVIRGLSLAQTYTHLGFKTFKERKLVVIVFINRT